MIRQAAFSHFKHVNMHVNVEIHTWFLPLEGQRVHIPVPQ